jgi:hypothetical protein
VRPRTLGPRAHVRTSLTAALAAVSIACAWMFACSDGKIAAPKSDAVYDDEGSPGGAGGVDPPARDAATDAAGTDAGADAATDAASDAGVATDAASEAEGGADAASD